jgi:hypothetical protein
VLRHARRNKLGQGSAHAFHGPVEVVCHGRLTDGQQAGDLRRGRRREDGADEIVYEPVRGLHQIERRVKAQGEHHRLLQPIRRKDEDGKLYDLTRVLFEEYRFFPFSPRDDFIDAVSRVYDMEPMPAIIYETLRVEDYPDA